MFIEAKDFGEAKIEVTTNIDDKMKSSIVTNKARNVWWDRLFATLHALVVLIVCSIYMVKGPHVSPIKRWKWTQGVGLLVFFLPFFTLWFQARLELAGSFSILPRAPKKLIVTGPYAILKHPIYTFSFLYHTGFLLMIDKLPSFSWQFFSYVLYALFSIYRARQEEALLRERFASDYYDYETEINYLFTSFLIGVGLQRKDPHD